MIHTKTLKKMTTTTEKAIAITFGRDDDYNFVSMTVWAKDSIVIFSTHDLESEEAKKWISLISIDESKNYYSL